MVDFGADVSFQESSKKLKEHYGMDIPPISVQRITQDHAKVVTLKAEEFKKIRNPSESETVIVESDGTLVPLVETQDEGFGEIEEKHVNLIGKRPLPHWPIPREAWTPSTREP